jgi:hypothetical protein
MGPLAGAVWQHLVERPQLFDHVVPIHRALGHAGCSAVWHMHILWRMWSHIGGPPWRQPHGLLQQVACQAHGTPRHMTCSAPPCRWRRVCVRLCGLLNSEDVTSRTTRGKSTHLIFLDAVIQCHLACFDGSCLLSSVTVTVTVTVRNI